MILDTDNCEDFLIGDSTDLIIKRRNSWPIYFTTAMKIEFLDLLIKKNIQLNEYEKIMVLEDIQGELTNGGD